MEQTNNENAWNGGGEPTYGRWLGPPSGPTRDRPASSMGPRLVRDPFDPGRQREPHRAPLVLEDDPQDNEPADRSLSIAVDFDGVLFDHVPYILRGFRDAHGIDLTEEGLQYWDFFQYRAVREKDLSWRCVRQVLDRIETDPALHREPPRDPYAPDVMQAWMDVGHEVRVVTARQEISREVTELFLSEHSIPHQELVMEASRKTGYDVLVDDSPHNVLMAAADGSIALLMDHPYNRDVPAQRNPRRVRDWTDIVSIIPPERPGSVEIRP